MTVEQNSQKKGVRKVSVPGIVVGALTDIVSTNVAMFPLIFYVIQTQEATGVPLEKAASLATEIIVGNTLYFLCHLGLGALCSILGGYISAKIAKHDEILNGTLSSFLCVAIGAYTMLSGHEHRPFWFHLLSLAAAVALAAGGGYIRWLQVRT